MGDRKTFWNAAELMSTTLPEPKWAVPGVVAEGLSLLAGPPKVGKSWLALNLALDVASSTVALGGIDVVRGQVLYLALEDTARRVQGRLRKMLSGKPAPRELHIATEWPGLAQGGAEQLSRWLTAHPTARLVVIDVLARIRAVTSGNGNAYAEDYDVMNQLKTVADAHQVAILVVTHVRKMAATDFLQQVSGTNGLAGAADCTIVLSRGRGEDSGELNITGRDVEEATYGMRWDKTAGRWDLDGNSLAEASGAALRAQLTIGLGDRSTEIVEFISGNPEGVRAKDVAEHLGIDQDKVRPYLQRLEQSERISKPRPGLYMPVTGVTTVTDYSQPALTPRPEHSVTTVTSVTDPPKNVQSEAVTRNTRNGVTVPSGVTAERPCPSCGKPYRTVGARCFECIVLGQPTGDAA